MNTSRQTNVDADAHNTHTSRWTRFKARVESRVFPGPEDYPMRTPDELRGWEVDRPPTAGRK